jgi:hypothetical protein
LGQCEIVPLGKKVIEADRHVYEEFIGGRDGERVLFVVEAPMHLESGSRGGSVQQALG